MVMQWLLFSLLVGEYHCTYAPRDNGAKVNRRFLAGFGMHFGMDIGHSHDICHNIPCGTHTASFDSRWQSCRCGNYALCLTKDSCHLAMAGCQYDHVDCEHGHCICRIQQAHQSAVMPTHKTGYSCHDIPCGASSASWDPFGRICRCGFYAFCDDVNRCEYVLYYCPRERRACDNGICVCRPEETHSHSTEPSNFPTSTLPLTTETHESTISSVQITESTIPKTSLMTTARSTSVMTQTITSTPLSKIPTSAATSDTTTTTASTTTSTSKPTTPLTTTETTTRTSPPVWITIPF